jgi:hypothetical protein
MATLTIGNRDVEVSDDFLKLSPEQQNETVEEIAQSLGITGDGAGSDMPEEPEMTVGRAAGLAGRAGVQAAPGAIAGLPALFYDGVQQAANWGYQGIDALAGTDLAETHRRGWGGPLGTVNRLQQAGEMAADAVGLPQPETEGERIAVAGGQTVLETLSGAGLAKVGAKTVEGGTRRVLMELAEAPKTQAFIGGAAGLGGQAAAESDINPLIGTGAGLALGLGGVAAGHGIRQGVHSGSEVAKRTLARGDDVQRQLAAERIRNAASDPDAAFRELDEGAGAELVPGSRPTTFQATGDMGLGSLERELQTANPEVFAQRRGAQNSARLESLRSVEGEGNASEIISFLDRQLKDIDSMTAGYEARARSAAEDAASGIQPAREVEDLGNSLRDSMGKAEDIARERESSLWDAVDPDGTLTVAPTRAKQAVANIYDNMTRAGRAGMTAKEKELADIVREYENVVSFREMKELATQIKEAMRAELGTPGRGRTETYRRLVQLSDAVRAGMTNSAAERIASDPVALGAIARWADEFNVGKAGGSTGREVGQVRSVQAGGIPGLGGAESSQRGQSGSNARTQGVQGQAGRGKPLSLTQFIAKNGGLPLDAESTARDWGNVSVGRLGKLARPDGRSIDGYWRNKLIDAGYLSRDADGYSSRDITKELYDAIENERAGRKTFTARDEMRSAGRSDVDGEEAEFLAASRQLREELETVGVRPEEMSAKAFNDAVERLARGEEQDAITAYERAVMALDDEGPVRATYAPREGSSAGSLLDGFRDDPEAGKRYNAATKATRERVGTFGRGTVRQILQREGDKDTFRMAPASVARNAFMPGPTGGERIKSIIKAGANPSDVAEIAAASLSKHIKDGVLDPKAFQRWRQQYDAALKELPQDVRAKFANASLASQTLNRVAALRKAKLDGFNKSILGKLAKVDPADLPKEIGGILNAKDSTAKMRTLSQAAKSNPAARDGLKRAVAEYIEGRFISNKEVAASGENGIRADAFASFVKDKAPALRQVFSGEDLVRMQAIADDIKRAERSLQAIKIPGNSNSPQDIGAALDKHAEKAGKSSLFSQIVVAAGGGALVGDFTGAAVGAVGAGVKHVLGSMRAAGLQKVDDLVLEMMLDPQLAKAALMKAPISSKGAQTVLSQVLSRRSPFAVSASVGGSDER